MQLERLLDSPLLRKTLMWASPALGVLGLGILLLPATIQLRDADPAPTVVADSDPAWRSATREDHADPEAGAATDFSEPAPRPGPKPGTGVRVREIDYNWLAAVRVQQAEDNAKTLSCIIEPFQVVKIGSPVTGLIETIHVERSDRVEAGQVLVELESGAERAAVQLARSQADMSEEIRAREASASLGERRRDRLIQLYEQGTVSLDLREGAETEAELARLELEQAHAQKKLAALQLEQALALLTRRTIRSPFSGVVVDRQLSPGERVQDEVILTVAQIDPLRVEVILPSSAFDSVEVGMRATVVPEFPGDTVYLASVTIVDRVIDAASGTFGVRLELPNPEHEIPSGLHCQVAFLSE